MARSSGLTKPAPRSRPSRQSALANGLKSYRAASPSPSPLPEASSSIPVPENHDVTSTSTAAGAGSSDNGFGTTTGKRRDNNFLEKLWHFLDSSDSNNIMGFSDNGLYLVMYDPEKVPEALSNANICKHKDYGSFQRQMCIYGWRRLAQSELPKLVLTEGESLGQTSNTLPGIKVMQHETLKRDSDMEDVRAVPRKAKPKASRAKNAEAARASSVASTSSSILPPTRPSQSLAGATKAKSARTARTKAAKPTKKSAYVEFDDDEEELNGEPSADDIEGVAGDAGSDMELETMDMDNDDSTKQEMDDDTNIDDSHSSKMDQDAIIIPADQLTAPPPIQLDMPEAPPPLPSGAMSIPIPGAQTSGTADGTTYASLPKSLQEAFLILDNLTPTPTLERNQDDAEMIDPSLVPELDTSRSALPPLPPATATSSLSNSKPVSTASSDGTDISTDATLTAAQRAYLAAAMQPPPTLPQPFYYQQESGPHFMQTEAAALSLPGHFRLTSPHVHRDT